jgi:hypothetical protein
MSELDSTMVAPAAPTGEIPAAPERTPRDSRGCGGVVLGSILVLIGIPMLICPGSGLAVILAGLGMIGVGLRFKNAGR